MPDHPRPSPRPSPRHRRLAPALLAPGLLLLAGCGSGADDTAAPAIPSAVASATSAASSAVSSAASAVGSSGDATEVDVTATEFAFDLSVDTFTPGTYTFVLDDAGSAPHALSISGPGVDESSDRVDPGGSTELTVDLQAGDYELLCPVGNHAARGMRMTITVG